MLKEKSIVIILILATAYVTGITVFSSPYYHLMINRFENDDSYSLKTDCSGFSVFTNLVERSEYGFMINYIEGYHLKSFTLMNGDLIEGEVVYIPILESDEFLLFERNGYKFGDRILLVSKKNGIAIGFFDYQFHDRFFKKFITHYDKCLKGNFNFNEK